jgi:nucleoid-associated protein EbfC
MQQAQQMQQQLATAQDELADAEVTGTAGGGLVTATLSGTGEVKAIKISPAAVDPADVETLEDLIVAALHAAAEEQQRLAEQKLGPLTGGLPGGGMPGLPGF